ncbi:MAG: acetyl-CoA carboxylase carboxyltransferase subunit alpha [Culicoidibacterales bacterium]
METLTREQLQSMIQQFRQTHGEQAEMEALIEQLKVLDDALEPKTAWDIVQLARHKARPTSRTYIEQIFPDFLELHGDRHCGDDAAVIAGIATFKGKAVTIIAQEKGQTTDEKIATNFGMLHPEGYRKAIRLAKQAEKFKRPIIFFIDTPGAYPGIEAEKRGQGEAIARCLFEFSNLKTPIISVLIGEGGSGGALAFAIADRLYMLENTIYSILSPEGFASILWKDASRAPEAAELLQLDAKNLLNKGMIDAIIEEPYGGAHMNLAQTVAKIELQLEHDLQELAKLSTFKLVQQRERKYRKLT